MEIHNGEASDLYHGRGANAMTEEIQKTANELAGDRTDLAIERTIMAASRTLMGWVRTALSLISFGFTIYKILQAARESAELGFINVHGPRRLGLILIGIGTASVVLGAIDYYSTLKRLNQMSAISYSPFNFTLIMGLLIGLFGLFLFVTIILHTEVF
jgi:putative membrane protein